MPVETFGKISHRRRRLAPAKDQSLRAPRALPSALVRFQSFNAQLSPTVLAATDIRGGGERWRLYLPLHCYLRNDSCIETGNDESHFNILFIVSEGRLKLQDRRQTTTFEERGELKRIRTEVLLLQY